MKINRAYRYELKPNAAQQLLLAKHAGCARFTWNWGLARHIALWETEQKRTNAMAQHREFNALKPTEFPWMYEVSKCASQEALRDLDRAFAHFFRGLKGQTGRKAGFPRFKRKGRRDSFRLTGSIHVREKSVQLPRMGVVRLKEFPVVEGRILSATVSREANRWYVSLAVVQDVPVLAPNGGPVVAIDAGLVNFAIFSDSRPKLTAPKPLAQKLVRLRRYQRRCARKMEAAKRLIGLCEQPMPQGVRVPISNNLKQAQTKVARLHQDIRNIRQDFLHKATTQLAKNHGEIVLEDLNVAGMVKNKHLARHIADVSWAEFRRQLKYKCLWYGSKLTLAPRYFPSSKTCSVCGHLLQHLPLSARTWICPQCGTTHDRDHNAAKNLLRWAVTNATASSAGSQACGAPSDGVGASDPASHGARKQEANKILVYVS